MTENKASLIKNGGNENEQERKFDNGTGYCR